MKIGGEFMEFFVRFRRINLETWLHQYGIVILILLLLGFTLYSTYKFIYKIRINKILKKEEKPKKIISIELVSFGICLAIILSFLSYAEIRNYIYRDINIKISDNLRDIDIVDIYKQLDNYSSKNKKIKLGNGLGISLLIDKDYNLINNDQFFATDDFINIIVPKMGEYVEYKSFDLSYSNVTLMHNNYVWGSEKLKYTMDIDNYYSSINEVNKYLKNVFTINHLQYDAYNIKLIYRVSLKEQIFNNIEVINNMEINYVSSFSYSGCYTILSIGGLTSMDADSYKITGIWNYYIF